MSTTILFLSISAMALMLSVAITYLLTHRLILILQAKAILDTPNHRSSHTIPTPRGGGWGIVVTWGICAMGLSYFVAIPESLLWLIPAIILLMLVSWYDDLGHVSWWKRLSVQMIAVICGVLSLPDHPPFFNGLFPNWLETTGIILFWLWFINLTNFIDGIDGITGSNGTILGIGVAFIAILTSNREWLTPFGLMFAGTMIGFLAHNWHPARIFLGDVGSVPIGFISAFLLLMLACNGYVVAAILLPLIPFCDATYTLLKRKMNGKKLTEAHREHAYQAGAIQGVKPPHILRIIVTGNIMLLILAIVSSMANTIEAHILLLILGALITSITLMRLKRLGRILTH